MFELHQALQKESNIIREFKEKAIYSMKLKEKTIQSTNSKKAKYPMKFKEKAIYSSKFKNKAIQSNP